MTRAAEDLRAGDTATAAPADTSGETAVEATRPPAPTGERPPRAAHTGRVVAGLTAVLALPLAVAVTALRSPRWYPLLDLAQTELRVRDVGTRHTPLVGLISRVVTDNHPSSHPGPLSFYALAPVYRLLGGSAWSLLLGVVVLNTVALGLAMWIAVRRGGPTLAVGLAAAVALLLGAYGTNVLTEPWNPYMPVLWWLVTVLAVWSVLCDDLAMLPVAVFAGSFCAQTHVSYLGLVGGLGAVALAAVALRYVRLRGDPGARRRLVGWTGVSLALAVALWLPPLVDQVHSDPGNAGLVVDYFRHPPSAPLGLADGARLFAVRLDVWRFVTGARQATSGSALPALALVAVWLAAAATAWRLPAPEEGGRARSRRTLLRLHAVIAAALVLGLVSSARIVGEVWFYLTLWAWAITALILLAAAWTAVLALAGWRVGAGARPHRAARVVPALAGAVLVVATARFAISAAGAQVSEPRLSAGVAAVAPDTIAALDRGDVPGGGPAGRYLVTWTDGTALGSAGWGLLDELERAGFHVGVIPVHGVGAKPHRVMPSGQATAEVHVAVGPDIATWRDRPGARQVSYVDERSPAERREYAALRSRVVARLRADGRDDTAADVDRAPFALYLDPALPAATRRDVQRMIKLGLPTAVFVAPVAPGT